jgi:hypothetical protein
LLRQSTGTVVEVGMIFNLGDRRLMDPLFFAVVVRPSDKFDICTAMAVYHVAVTTVRSFCSHGTSSWGLP